LLRFARNDTNELGGEFLLHHTSRQPLIQVSATTAMARRRETAGGYMAQENRSDPARLEQIERRLQVLEDAEAIRNLKRAMPRCGITSTTPMG
jgi:hypothetical protein